MKKRRPLLILKICMDFKKTNLRHSMFIKKKFYFLVFIVLIACNEDNSFGPSRYTEPIWEVSINDCKDYPFIKYYLNDDKRLDESEKYYNKYLGKGLVPYTEASSEIGGLERHLTTWGYGPILSFKLGSLLSIENIYLKVKYFYDEMGYLKRKETITLGRYTDTLIQEYFHKNGKLTSIRARSMTFTMKYQDNLIVGVEEIPDLLLEYDKNSYLKKISRKNYSKEFIYKDNYHIVEIKDPDDDKYSYTLYIQNNQIVKYDHANFEYLYYYVNGKIVKHEHLVKSSNKKNISNYIYKHM